MNRTIIQKPRNCRGTKSTLAEKIYSGLPLCLPSVKMAAISPPRVAEEKHEEVRLHVSLGRHSNALIERCCLLLHAHRHWVLPGLWLHRGADPVRRYLVVDRSLQMRLLHHLAVVDALGGDRYYSCAPLTRYSRFVTRASSLNPSPDRVLRLVAVASGLGSEAVGLAKGCGRLRLTARSGSDHEAVAAQDGRVVLRLLLLLLLELASLVVCLEDG